MKSPLFGIIAILSLLAGCANLPSQNAWNTLTGQDNRSWGYAQIQAAEQARAIFAQPFRRKGRGHTYSRHQIQFDQIVLPPNSLNTLKLRTYCMDKSVPAPKRNEKLYLVPVGNLIDRQIYPIYKSLMKYSHSHPEKHSQIQRIVWNLRSTKNPSEMRNEDYALLDTIHPGASQAVRSYFYTKNLTGRATDFLSDAAGKFLNQQGGLGSNLLNQQNLVSTALHSISQSNSQVDSILRSLESMPVSGLIPNDNSDYSLLTNGVAVKATHRGGARNSELTIRNANDYPVVFQPTDYALESKRKTQRLGVGGVDKIEQEIYEVCDNFPDINIQQGLSVIKNNAGYIKNAAEKYHVDPAIVAGVIYAENMINVDWKDHYVEPYFAELFPKLSDFIGISLGMAQVRLTTMKLLQEEGYIKSPYYPMPRPGLYPKSLPSSLKKYTELIKKHIEYSQKPDVNALYAAAYIKFLSDKYPKVKDMPGIMATLYNIGHKSKDGRPRVVTSPYGYNCFGKVVRTQYGTMKMLIEEYSKRP